MASVASMQHGGYAPHGDAPAPYAASAASDGDDRPMLLVTTVDVGRGRAARIEVRAGDDPQDVARAFCARHRLPEAIVLPLAAHLEENLAGSAAGTPLRGGSDSGDEEEHEDEVTPGAAQRYTPSPPPAYAGHPEGPSMASPEAAAEQQRGQGAGTLQQQGGDGGAAEEAPPGDAQQQQRPLAYQPACATSAHGAQYFNRPPPGSTYSGSSGDSSGGLGYRSGGAALNAHSRLYADHFRKQQRLEEERRLRDLEVRLKTEQVHIAPASCKLASHRTAGQYRNYGERLYVEGRLDAMRKEQLAQRTKEEAARAELEAFTFQPEISRMAQQIKASEAEMGPAAATAYQRLYQRGGGTAKRQVGQKTAERMDAIRREQDAAEVKECSFRPQLNSRSMRMVEQRQEILRESGLPGYEQLYHDCQRRQAKLAQLAAQPPEEATFQPQVNTSSVVLKKLLEGREEEGLLGGGSADVATRLLERGRKYQEKLVAAQRQAAEAPRDAATGRPLFQPKTHRAPQYERNPEGAPIGEYLYSIKAEWDERAARLRETRARRTAADAASTYVNTRSERMVDHLKRERFTAIFDYLRRGDPCPHANLLEAVADEAFMDTIDPEVRADVEFAARLLNKHLQRRGGAAPGLADCASSAAPRPGSAGAGGQPAYAQSTAGEVDASGFVALMEEVVGRTKGLTRQYLLPMPSGRPKFEEPSFRPSIDRRSHALATQRRPDSLPAYEHLYRTAEAQVAKKEEQRRAAEAARLKECIFKPVMVSQHMAKEGRAIKMAATLTQSKRPTDDGEQAAGEGATASANPAPATGGAAAVHFASLERQINDALVRLSLSEEQVAASLRQAGAGAAAEQAAPAQADRQQEQQQQDMQRPAPVQVAQSTDLFDYRALLGTPSPELAALGASHDQGPAHTGGCSSLGGFNPLDDADAAWAADSQGVEAHADGPAGGAAAAAASPDGLSGLDLHALASADLPEHPAAAAQQHSFEATPEPEQFGTPLEQLDRLEQLTPGRGAY